MRIVMCSLVVVVVVTIDVQAQVIRGSVPYTFNHNPAAISSSPQMYRTPPTVVYPQRVVPGLIPQPMTVYGGGAFFPFGVYGYGFQGFGGWVDPNFYPPSRGGYLNQESAIFAPPQDNLAATIPSLAPMTYQPRPPQAFTGFTNQLPAPKPSDGVARFTLQVPADAEVYLEGQRMEGTGTVRKFVSPKLSAGKEYLYEIEIRWRENGKSMNRSREITVQAGDSQSINFVGTDKK